MRILACPGQGSQSEGFLSNWIQDDPGFEEQLARLAEASGLDLIELGTTATEESIKDTANAQPLIVAASIAAARSLFGQGLAGVDGVVGHSVGEFAAAAMAGVITDQQAMQLVSVRARAMAVASRATPSSMAAVIGLDLEAAEAAAAAAGLEIANYNGGGQFVLAGATPGIEALVTSPPAGARVIPLKVAGAFHTSFMSAAEAELESAASGVTASNPILKIWSNKDGLELTDGAEVLRRLVSQVASPVRFDLNLANLVDAQSFIELPPAGALAGLAKRELNCEIIALRNPADFAKLGPAGN
jgi:[acyl-carrier-protein] S-malonyltransferase